MSYEECPIHHCDATNGCPQCICKECDKPYGNNHTAIFCETQQVRNVLKELVVATGARNIEGGATTPSFLRFEKALSTARKFLENARYGKDYVSAYPSGVTCLHCGNWNQNDPENARDTCWKCHGELPPIDSPAKHTGGDFTVEARRPDYTKPTLQELRLGRIIGEAAVKWWKVEDWFKKNSPEKFIESDDQAYALFDFIVLLLQEK